MLRFAIYIEEIQYNKMKIKIYDISYITKKKEL